MLFGVNTISGLRHCAAPDGAKGGSTARREGWRPACCRGRRAEEALDACAGVLRPLTFVPVRKEQDEAGEKIPFVFTGDDELVDDGLRDVGEVAELRLPDDQSFGIVAAVSVFEAHDPGFGKRRSCRSRQGAWPGASCSAARIPFSSSMSMSTEWRWLKVPRRQSCPLRRRGCLLCHERSQRRELRPCRNPRPFAIAHLVALFEQLFHFGVDVEVFRITE